MLPKGIKKKIYIYYRSVGIVRSRTKATELFIYYIYVLWEVVGLEWGPLSLVSTTEEVLGRKRSGSGLENQEYGRRDPSR
jgi:hypothetical protein